MVVTPPTDSKDGNVTVTKTIVPYDSVPADPSKRWPRSRLFVMPITLRVLQYAQLDGLNACPLRLNIIDNCLICPVREEHLFCNLPLPAVQRLNEIKSTAVYPKSTMLFIEGQQPRGVFVLCMGKAKLFTSSSDGKTIITKISEAGDVLGLYATISNRRPARHSN